MHDFGVSHGHVVIMDLQLYLDPLGQARGMPSLCYDSTSRSRFGVFPRHDPVAVRWFETHPCLIFHTANTWDGRWSTANTCAKEEQGKRGWEGKSVHMLACRLTSASVVFGAGNIPVPDFKPVPPAWVEEE